MAICFDINKLSENYEFVIYEFGNMSEDQVFGVIKFPKRAGDPIILCDLQGLSPKSKANCTIMKLLKCRESGEFPDKLFWAS